MIGILRRYVKRIKARKASEAARALSARAIVKHDDARQALIDKLCGELGKPSIKLMRRG